MHFSMASSWRSSCAGLTVGLLIMSGLVKADMSTFDFKAFGNFRRMTHTGDTSGQVRLADLPQAAGTWGVGALAGLKGEVLLHDGRLLVSRGEDAQGRVSSSEATDEAVLFAGARVLQWADFEVPSELTRAEFEVFVMSKARASGLDIDVPFPFRLQGRFPHLVWHVVTGLPANTAGGESHG